MPNKVRSARGVMVDFDQLRIEQMKQQLTVAPVTADIRARQDFIERKLRRRLKKVETKVTAPDAVSIDVDPELPEPAVTQPLVAETKPAPVARKTRQKARSK